MKTIELAIEPMGAPRMTRRDVWLNPPRPPVQKYRIMKSELVKFMLENKFELPDVFAVDFYIPMAASWSQKKRANMDGKPHQQKPDIDNLAKGLLDCLKPDDCTVWDIHSRKFWSKEPRIIIFTE